MRRIIFVSLFACLFFAGCATQSGYYPARRSGEEGYSQTKIQDGVYSVQFVGMEEETVQRTADFALLRSAELALENGYKYFAIVNEKSEMKTVSEAIPYTVPAVCYPRHCFWPYVSGWQTYISQIPSTYFMIHCYKEKPENVQGMIFDAEQVRDNIRNQYRLKSTKASIQVPASQRS